MQWVTAGCSRKATFKPKNGDAFLIVQLNGCFLLLLAQGQNSAPCDWKASETALKGFMQKAETLPAIETHEQLDECITAASKSVAEIHGICQGAATQLTCVAVQENGSFRCTNVEVNIIFCFSEGTLTEITTDTGFLKQGEGLLLLNEGFLNHPSRSFLFDFQEWCSLEDPNVGNTALLEKYISEETDDLTTIFIKAKS